jgi:outer membrane protein assembly factor BamB
MISRLFALAAALILAAAGARADNWPEFRGPTGQGVYKGTLPLEWGPGRNVAWKQAVPGRGWSSPVVWEGRVYLTTAVPVDGAPGELSLDALALDARTGKPLWQTRVFRQPATAPRIQAKNSHASPTPVVDGRHLYVHFGHQGTACLDLAGKVLWRNTELKYPPVHGNGGSPILAGDLLVFSCDGGSDPFVAALERDAGKVRWKVPRGIDAFKPFSFSTPLLIEVNGTRQIVSPGSEAVMAYEPATGKEIWRVCYPGGYSVVPRPVYGHGLVYVCTGYESPRLLAIRPDGRGDVTTTHVAWQTRQAVPHTPSLLLDGDELYMISDGGFASCLDARTGRQHWRKRLPGAYSASPLLAGGRIYFQNEAGTGVVVQAGKEYKELARNALGERTLASYAAADGALFIRTDRHLYRIEAGRE